VAGHQDAASDRLIAASRPTIRIIMPSGADQDLGTTDSGRSFSPPPLSERAKRELDPQGMLNPGVLVDP